MARGVIIPKSTQLGNAVAPALSLPKLDAETNGGQLLAAGGDKLAANLASIAADIKADRDQVRTQDAFSSLDREWQNVQARDFLSLKGPDVLPNQEGRGSVVEDGLAFREKMLSEALPGLDNDDQRAALKAAWNARSRFANERLLNHQIKEEENYRDATDAASIATSVQLIPTQSDAEVRESLEDIRTIVERTARRNNWGPDERNQAEIRFASPALVERILLQAETDAASARKTYEQYEGLIEGGKRRMIEKALREEGSAQRGQVGVEAVYATSTSDASLVDLLDRAKSMYSGEDLDNVQARIVSRYNQEKVSKSDQKTTSQELLGASTFQMFENGKYPTPEAAEAQRSFIIRTARDQEYSPGETSAALSILDNEIARNAKTTQWDFYYEIKNNPSLITTLERPTGEEDAQGNPIIAVGISDIELQANLATEQYKEVKELQAKRLAGEIQGKSLLDTEIEVELKRHEITGQANHKTAGEITGQITAAIRERQKDGPVTPAVRSEEIERTFAAWRKQRGWSPFGTDTFTTTEYIESVAEKNPNILGIAAWEASGFGTHKYTDAELYGRTRAIEARLDKLRRSGDKEAREKYEKHIETQGKANRSLLWRAHLDPTNQLRGREVVKQEQERLAPKRPLTGNWSLGGPQKSGLSASPLLNDEDN